MTKKLLLLALLPLGCACTIIAIPAPGLKPGSKAEASPLKSFLLKSIINDSQKTFHFRVIENGKIKLDAVIAPSQTASYEISESPEQLQLIGAFKNAPNYTLKAVGDKLVLYENGEQQEENVPLNVPVIIHIKSADNIRLVKASSLKEAEAPLPGKEKPVNSVKEGPAPVEIPVLAPAVAKEAPALSDAAKQKFVAEGIPAAINYIETLKSILRTKGQVSGNRYETLKQVADQLARAGKEQTVKAKIQYIRTAANLLADNFNINADKELEPLYGRITKLLPLLGEEKSVTVLSWLISAVRNLRDAADKNAKVFNDYNVLYHDLKQARDASGREQGALLRKAHSYIADNFGPQIPKPTAQIFFAIEKLPEYMKRSES